VCLLLVECCETHWSHPLKTVRLVVIAAAEVRTVRKMFQRFRFHISFGLKCLVSRPMPKDIVVLLLFIDCHNVRHEDIQLSASVRRKTSEELNGPRNVLVDRDSSVGIATAYVLNVSEFQFL